MDFVVYIIGFALLVWVMMPSKKDHDGEQNMPEEKRSYKKWLDRQW